MLDQLGKRKYVLPIGIIIAVACVFSLMFYPMAHLELKNLPMAIVCLDEGVSTSEGDVNLGELVVMKMTDTALDEEDSPIAWTQLSSEEELAQAMENNEYFGALVIPKDFSQQQYDTLVNNMQDQIDSMQDTITNKLPFESGGVSLPNMAAGNSGTPALSPEMKAGVTAAQSLASQAQAQAQSAAATTQQKAAALNQAKQELTKMEGQIASLETDIANKDAALEQATAGSAEAIQLEADIAKAKELLESEEANLSDAKAAVTSAEQNLKTAQENMATATANAKTATINAVGSEKTAVAGSTLAARASSFADAIGTLKDKLGSLDISSKFSDVGETIAAKALVNAAEKLEQGTDEDAESGPKVLVYLDMAKSPMIANTLKTTMMALFGQTGFGSEIMMIHDGTPEGMSMESALTAATAADEADGESASAASPLSSMMSLQISIIPVMMLSLVIGLILTRLFKFGEARTKQEKARCLVKQLVYSLVVSCLIALVAYGMFTWIADAQADFGTMFLYMWMVSFCMLLLASGLGNVALGLGLLVVICTIAFGNMTGAMPVEGLPLFWQDWVCPWAPQGFFGEGLRSIMYLGSGAWTAQSPLFACLGVVGLILSALALLKPRKA